MTDARYPEKWLTDRRLLRLTDAQHRAYVVSLVWSLSNRTDGRLDEHDLALVVGCDTSGPTRAALVAAKLWRTTENGWEIVDFSTTQTSAHELEVLDNLRRRDREKKARQRGAKGAPPEPVPGDVPGDGPGDVSPGTAQARQGQARQGQALEAEPPTNAGSEPSSWPPVAVPGRLQAVDCVCFADLPAGEHFDYCAHAKASA